MIDLKRGQWGDLAAGMLVYRPLMTDLTILLVLYFGSPGALCLAILVLWVHRGEPDLDAAIGGSVCKARWRSSSRWRRLRLCMG